jgi:hypothetical protein
MVNNISAPPEDRCAIESCRRPRREHVARGHVFVSAEQLASTRPRPRDPFTDVRKITDEDRYGVQSAPKLPIKAEPAAAEQPPIGSQTTAEQPPLCQLCDRPKRSHRGPIGHRFLAPGEDPSTLKPTTRPSRADSKSKDVNDELTSPPKALTALTIGMLAAIVDDAIRGMNTPSIPMIDDIHIAPEFNIDRSVIIAAKVKVTFSVAGDLEK